MSSPRGPSIEGPESPQGTLSFRRLLWQFGTLLLGFLLAVAFHVAFGVLFEQVEEDSADERARMFIGEEIARQIRGIESDVYHLATVVGWRGHEHVTRRIEERVAIVRQAVAVLRDGGVFVRRISPNRYGDEQVIQRLHYRRGPGGTQYPVEVIDLLPKLDEVEVRVGELLDLLARRDAYREAQQPEGLLRLEAEVSSFLKHLPARFVRLSESANQLLLDSHRRLAELEARARQQKVGYVVGELAGVVAILAALGALGVRFARHTARSNEQLRLAWQSMRAARDEAEQASRAKSAFVSRMSHELRTPMNAILGFAQLLDLSPSLRPEQRAHLREIHRAGNHLLSLINDVLDLAKIEAGELTFERIPFDLVETADEVVAVLGEWVYARGLDLDAFVSPDLPLRVLGDPTRVRQVLINLLSNAVKFTERGSVGLRVEPTADGRAVRFEVCDTGIGFDVETAARLFRPFTQADGSTSRRFGGSGLGLVICKDLVQGMGGALRFESVPGEGSRFWFELPLAAARDGGPRPAPLTGATVLLVSARAGLARTTARYVAALGGRLRYARDGARALTLARERPVALVLLDAPFHGLAEDLAGEGRVLLVRRAGSQEQAGTLLDPRVGSVHEPLTYSRLREALAAPVAAVPAGESSAPEAAPPPGPALEGRVLLVEDNPVNQLVALEMLSWLGLKVQAAGNGLEALEHLAGGQYDLVLMDVEMPGLDGYETTRRIRAGEASTGQRRLPVIAMTANALSEDRERCLASGMDDHIAKPVTMEQLAGVLRRWLAPAGQALASPGLRQAG